MVDAVPESDKADGPDAQRVEVLGRNLLVSNVEHLGCSPGRAKISANLRISELLRSGVEVARPERDHGIDLIAYLDQDLKHGRFTALPIQMKASLTRNFSISRKYERFPGLLIVYVWYCDDPENTALYALTYQEAHDIAERQGWLKTSSWESGRHYVTTKPSAALVAALAHHKVESGKWKEVVRKAAQVASDPAPAT